MKKKIFSLFVALVATVAVQAQMISAVAPNGATTLYQTLPEAIAGAQSGSVLYLPGGGFAIGNDDVITKKLTIMGIGHKSQNDNADGRTTIVGSLRFRQGSDGSAVMGCYINDNVYIGNGDGPVNDVLVKLCSLNDVRVENAACTGTVISQNYIRGSVWMGPNSGNRSEGTIKNNILYNVRYMSSGEIKNNIFRAGNSNYESCSFYFITTATIINNILLNSGYYNRVDWDCGTLYTSGNARLNDEWGDDPVKIEAENWDDVFENYNGGAANTLSNFHFKEAYKQYERQVGIYAGDGFDDSQLAPTPRIVSKHIPDQTNAAGKLVINVRVKASE